MEESTRLNSPLEPPFKKKKAMGVVSAALEHRFDPRPA